jgi:hypothetical protein
MIALSDTPFALNLPPPGICNPVQSEDDGFDGFTAATSNAGARVCPYEIGAEIAKNIVRNIGSPF